MNYAAIKSCDFANGPGVRVSLFVSGCTLNCHGCFNKNAQDFSYGQPFTKETEETIISLLNEAPYIRGLSVLGGEPFEKRNIPDLISFLKSVRDAQPFLDIWIFSGHTFEEIVATEGVELLKLADVLVDGPFLIEAKDPTLRFRGSSNQRLIDVPKSLACGEVVLYDE